LVAAASPEPPLVVPASLEPPLVAAASPEPPVVVPASLEPPVVVPASLEPPLVAAASLEPPLVVPASLEPPLVAAAVTIPADFQHTTAAPVSSVPSSSSSSSSSSPIITPQPPKTPSPRKPVAFMSKDDEFYKSQLQIAKDYWHELGIEDFGDDEPPLPANIQDILDKLSKQGSFELVLVPKGLFLDDFIEDNGFSGEEYAVEPSEDSKNLMDSKVENSYWVLVAKEPLQGSKGETYKQQVDRLKQSGEIGGFKLDFPKACEFLAVCAHSDVEPSSYTRTQDVVRGYQVTIGLTKAYDIFIETPYDAAHEYDLPITNDN
jgi:hypothetical protein